MSATFTDLNSRSFKLLCLLLIVATTSTAFARGARRSEADRMSPGADGNLHWVPYGDVAKECSQTKKPVMIYLFEGVKNSENVQEMISAQLRLFTDADVQRSAASLVCTKVNRQRPDDLEALRVRNLGKFLDHEDPQGEDEEGGDGGEEAEDEEGGDGEFDPRKDEAEEDEEGTDGAGGFIVDPKDWPDELCLHFVDYRGRPITTISEITSKRAQFVSTVKKVLKTNSQRVRADERAAEKAARKAAKEEKAKADKANEEKQK